jgi:hypothetical protein
VPLENFDHGEAASTSLSADRTVLNLDRTPYQANTAAPLPQVYRGDFSLEIGSEPKAPEDENMATDNELTDAKLATAEAKTESRFIELSGKIDRLTDLVTSSVATSTNEFVLVERRLTEVRDDNKNTRWTIVVTVIISMLAAMGALWATQNNLLAAFSAGIALRTETKEAPAQATLPPKRP